MSHLRVGRLSLIGAALEDRLGKVQGLLPGEMGETTEIPVLSRSQAEEKLRHLMVRAWPARTGQRVALGEWDAFLTEILELEPIASEADLRFLDAFNRAFEAMQDTVLLDVTPRPPVIRFLRAYERVLRLQTGRLLEEDAERDRSRE